jgi:hypothetical protein
VWDPNELATEQDVKLDSTGTATTVNLAGNLSILNILMNLGNGAEDGVGGFLSINIHQNFATAYIDDLATVSAARDVSLKTHGTETMVTVVSAGNYGKSLGADGAFIYDRIKNNSLAWIENRAAVHAGHDVILDAQSDLKAYSITPALSVGGKKGVGISASFTDVRDRTQAFIGDLEEAVDPLGTGGVRGTVTAGHDVSLSERSTPQVWSVAASVGVAPGGASATDNGGGGVVTANGSGGAINADTGLGTISSAGGGTSSGLGVAGSVAFNWVEQDTRAFIRDLVTVKAGDQVKAEAFSNPEIVALAGGFAFGNSKGIGATFAFNHLDQTTTAFVDHATVTNLGNGAANPNLELYAHSDNTIVAITASGGGDKTSFAAAGAFNFGDISNNTSAYVGDDSVLNVQNLDVHAENHYSLQPVAGALALDIQGDFGFGASVSLTFVTTTVHAWVSGSANVAVTGDAQVHASDNTRVITLAAAISASVSGSGATGSVASVTLKPDVQAYVSGVSHWDAAAHYKRGDVVIGSDGKKYVAKVDDPTSDPTVPSAASAAEWEQVTAQLAVTGSLFVDADESTHLIAIGGAIAGSDNTAIGIAGANVNIPDRKVKAYIGGGATVDVLGQGVGITDPDGTGFGGAGIGLDATTDDHLLVIAGGGAGSDSFAGAGSVVVVTMGTSANQTEAYIGAGAQINTHNTGAAAAQGVRLRADDHTHLIGIGGGIAGASTAGVGVAANVVVLSKSATAHIDPSALVNALGDVTLSTSSEEDVTAVSAAGAFGGDAGVAVSPTIMTLTTVTRAYIDHDAVVNAGGNVAIGATGTFTARLIAGSLGFGGTAGVGAANTTLVHNDTVEAFVGNSAQVTASGSGGLSVAAMSSEDLITIAVGAAIGGDAAVLGSAVVNVLNETTRAYIGQSATITTANGGVRVTASDATSIVGVAGSFAASGEAAVGLGADVGPITKHTVAYIGSGVTANVKGDIIVKANSTEDITSVAAGVALSTAASIGLNASVHVLTLDTRAFIGDDPRDELGQPDSVDGASAGAGDVHAQGSVDVAADDQTDMNKITGVLAIGVYVGLGAAGNVAVVDKTTEAFIGAGAKVRGDGNSAGLTVETGGYSLQPFDNTASHFDAGNPAGQGIEANSDNSLNANSSTLKGQGQVNVPNLGSMDADQSGGNNLTDPSLSGKRVVAPSTATGFHSVAVTANNRDNLRSLTIALAGGIAGIAVAADVKVVNAHTRAYVGDGAIVNQDTTGASGTQTVEVGAGDDFYHLGLAGSIGGGVVGVAPAVDVTVVGNTTEAYISSNATVNAVDDVRVEAHATDGFLLIGFGVAGGLVGVGAAVSVLSLNDKTNAYIGGNATVFAGGDVLVNATDETTLTTVTGALAGGFVGVGGAVGVMSITKDTEAWVAADAKHVDALGGGTGIGGVLDGSIDTGGDKSFTKHTEAHGVIVQAQSKENVFHLAVTAAGGFVGVSGGVSVTLISATTKAFIGNNAQVNQTNGNAGANPNQGVYVTASDEARNFTFAGAVAGGFVGVSGGVDFGELNNNTSAEINGNVAARKDVEVNAVGIKNLRGFTFSGAGGFVGVTGAVSVWSVGMPIQRTYQDNDGNSADSSQAGGSGAQADDDAAHQAQTTRDGDANHPGVAARLGQFDSSADPNSNQGRLKSATDSASSRLTTDWPTQAGIDGSINTPPQAGTTAAVGATAVVSAGGNVQVKANENLKLNIIVGGLAGGLVGVGGAVSVASVADNATAHADGKLSAGGAIAVDAELAEIVTVSCLSGQAGVVGLGAAVVVLHDNSKVQAYLGGTADVMSAASVSVNAHSDQHFTTHTGEVAIGAGAIGAAFARVTAAGSVSAQVGTGAQIGQHMGQNVGSLSVTADSTVNVDAPTVAVAAGGVAVGANFSFATVSTTTEASVGGGSHTKLTGAFTVQVTSNNTATAQTPGVSAGAYTASAMLSKAPVNGSTTAFVGDGAVVNYGGAGTMTADGTANATGDATTVGVGVASVGLADVEATIGAGVDAHIGNKANVTGGSLKMSAAGHDTVQASMASTSVGGITLSGSIVNATDTSTVEAYVGPKQGTAGDAAHPTTLTTTAAGGISVGAGLDSNVTATTDALSIGLLGDGAVTSTTATANPSIRAYVGDQAALNSGSQATTFDATGTLTAHAHGSGVGISLGFSGGGALATANVGDGSKQTVAAFTVGGGSLVGKDVHFGAQLNINAPGTGATADVTLASIGLIAGVSGGVSTANNKPVAEAAVGAGTTVTVTGKLEVTANTGVVAGATTHGVAGGLVGFGASLANATASPKTSAHLDGVVQDGSGGPGADNVNITASSTDSASAVATAVSGGLIAGTDNHAQVTAAPVVSAAINSGGVVNAGSNITISASEYPETDGFTKGITGGAVAVGASQTDATITPQVTAALKAKTVRAGTGDITVSALVAPQSGTGIPNYQILGIDAADGTPATVAADPLNNTLNVANHGLHTGDVVVYDPGNPLEQPRLGEPTDNNLIGGIVASITDPHSIDPNTHQPTVVRREYNVLVADSDHLALGAQFDGAQVLKDSDEIRIPTPHNLQTGDKVVYQPATVTVGGLTPGASYYVLVIDDKTIKLANPDHNLKSFSPSDIMSDTIKLVNHQFADGEAVTYHAPAPDTFQSDQVNVTVNGDNSLTNNPGANNIYFADPDTGAPINDGFTDGELVVYRAASGHAISGLIDGATYKVHTINSSQVNLEVTFTGSLSFTKNNPGNDTVTRTTGDWVSDGFFIGQTIRVTAGLNNGATYTISNIIDSNQTLVLNVSNNVGPGTAVGTIDGIIALHSVKTIKFDAGSGHGVSFAQGGSIHSVVATYVPQNLLMAPPAVTLSGLSAVSFARHTGGDTITRGGGSWVNDGFAPGKTIAVTGTASNDGTYIVANATDSVLTLTVVNKVTVEGPESATVRIVTNSVTFAPQSLTIPITYAPQSLTVPVTFARKQFSTSVTFAPPQHLTLPLAYAPQSLTVPVTFTRRQFSVSVTFARDPAGDTITRDTGSWVNDGFAAGQIITVTGTAGNNRDFTIAKVTDNILTLVQGNSVTNEGPETGTFTINAATGDTITRGSGSWVSDGFAAGQSITVSGTPGSNGTYTVLSVTDLVLTVAFSNAMHNEGPESATISTGAGDRIVRTSGSFISDLFTPGETINLSGFGIAGHNGSFTIASVSAQTLTLTATTTGSDDGPVSATIDGTSGDRIVRSSGSFVADGFFNGQTITISGTAGNNGTFTIANVSDLTLTLTSVNGVIKEGPEPATITMGGATGDTITRASGSWLRDGFAKGQTITVSGTANNNGNYTIKDVTDLVLTVVFSNNLHNASGSATISTGAGDRIVRSSGSWVSDLFAPGQTVTVSGTAGHNGTFTIAGVSDTTLTLTASTSGADEGPVSATFSEAAGDRIIRKNGSWLADGF